MVANPQTFVAMSLEECGTASNHSIIKFRMKACKLKVLLKKHLQVFSSKRGLTVQPKGAFQKNCKKHADLPFAKVFRSPSSYNSNETVDGCEIRITITI